jgi:DNA ligase-1
MSEVVKLKNQFEEIRLAKGKEKIEVIKKYKDDELFKEVAHFVFSPFFTTGIAKKKIEKELGATPYYNPNNTLFHMFNLVRQHNSGSDTVVKSVQSWILGQPHETHQFLKEVFTQDMQIGATSSSFNKAIGAGFIPEHNIQLAKKYEDDKEKFTKGSYCINLKIDGYRATIKSHEDFLEILSKSGMKFEGLLELEAQLNQLPRNYVYDGELLYIDETMRSDDRFRKTGSILKSKGEKKDIIFVLFDLLPLDEFEQGESKLIYDYRLSKMYELMTYCESKNLNLIQMVPIYYVGEDHSKVAEYVKIVEEQGYEGLMLNDMNSKYIADRHVGLMKVKKFYTADLKITGYVEHKHPGKLGAFIVDYKGYPARIGGGYSNTERIKFWEDRDKWIGKIIEVELFQESNNKNGTVGIRHANFVRIRWDKTDVSYD